MPFVMRLPLNCSWRPIVTLMAVLQVAEVGRNAAEPGQLRR